MLFVNNEFYSDGRSLDETPSLVSLSAFKGQQVQPGTTVQPWRDCRQESILNNTVNLSGHAIPQ
jgi:hypothetical protein